MKKHFPIKAFYTAENNKICEKLAVKVTRFMTEMFEQPSLVEAARLLRLQRAARNAGDNMDDVEVVQELTLEERLAVCVWMCLSCVSSTMRCKYTLHPTPIPQPFPLCNSGTVRQQLRVGL